MTMREWKKGNDELIIKVYKVIAQEMACKYKLFITKMGGTSYSVLFGKSEDVIEYRKDKNNCWENLIEIDCYDNSPRFCYRDNARGLFSVAITSQLTEHDHVYLLDEPVLAPDLYLVSLQVYGDSGITNLKIFMDKFLELWRKVRK